MSSINVNIKQENIVYKINFCNDIFEEIKKNVTDYQKRKFLFVVDSEVYKLYFDDNIPRDKAVPYLYDKNILILPNWEKNKTIKSVFKIIDKLMELNFSRKDYVVALWWGVIWDITWFASSIFKRWINLIQVPTTLLSMFDSSVWWKTGVDYMWVKNWIWTFYSANYVLIDQNFLKTLPKKELLWWYFEWLKHSILLWKKDFLDFCISFENIINKNFSKETEKIISKNIACKLKVVKSDPFELNWKRKVLNYGHTFGHALETYLNFKLWHGICVWFGIIYANLLSRNLWFLNEEIFLEIWNFIKQKLKTFKLTKLNLEEIYKLMLSDKKNDNSEINFILIKDFWNVFEHKVKKEEFKKAFDDFESFIEIKKVFKK